MELFNVAFIMPDWIRAGLDSGAFKVVGGVIRRSGGKQEIVAWLRPATDAAGEMVTVGPNLGTLAGGAALSIPAAPVIIGAAVIVAVMAAGFVVVVKKLNAIDEKLNEIIGYLRDIKEDLAWLKQSEWTKQRAAVYAAFQGCADAEKFGRYEAFPAYVTTFREAQHFYLEQMKSLSMLPSPLQLSTMFADISQLYAAVSQAKGLALALSNDPESSREELRRDGALYAQVRSLFLQSIKNPKDNLERLVDLTPVHWEQAAQVLTQLPPVNFAACLEIEGFDYSREALIELRSLAAPGANQPCALIVSKAAIPSAAAEKRGWLNTLFK
jgi:hypothetical protein